jgi:hypothetical protein
MPKKSKKWRESQKIHKSQKMAGKPKNGRVLPFRESNHANAHSLRRRLYGPIERVARLF